MLNTLRKGFVAPLLERTLSPFRPVRGSAKSTLFRSATHYPEYFIWACGENSIWACQTHGQELHMSLQLHSYQPLPITLNIQLRLPKATPSSVHRHFGGVFFGKQQYFPSVGDTAPVTYFWSHQWPINWCCYHPPRWSRNKRHTKLWAWSENDVEIMMRMFRRINVRSI